MTKTTVVCVAACLVASSAFAELKKDEVKRLNDSAAVVSELRSAPDSSIPDDLWNKAECVLVFPSVKKAAFIVGGEFGTGVMTCRQRTGAEGNARGNGRWSPPVFMHLEKGSFGAQFGAEEVDLVLLVMNRGGVDKLLEDKVSLGGDVSIAGGPVGRSGTAATDAQMNTEMLAYSRSRGIFAGIDLSGGAVRADVDANRRAYGPSARAIDIVHGTQKVTEPAAARSLVAALDRNVRPTTGHVR
jgi:SH3 domain-containing YSC84-like protein 1